MNWTAIIVVIYGALLMVGGTFGYVKAKSMISLVMGLSSGLVMLSCAVAMFKGHMAGHYIALAGAFGLTLLFFYRFFKTFAFMPAGLMLVISLLTSLLLMWQLRGGQS